MEVERNVDWERMRVSKEKAKGSEEVGWLQAGKETALKQLTLHSVEVDEWPMIALKRRKQKNCHLGTANISTGEA
eukprot:scaffold115652_cov10-Tisochrysis_lutea.AAC.1